MKYIFFTLISLGLLLILTSTTFKETNERKVIKFSGLVVTGDSLRPVPFTNIWVKNTRRGTITNFEGFFSIAVRELDTLRFTAVGFKEITYVIPDTLGSARYSAIQLMTRDTIYLPETVIYPWPTREQFRYAFLNTEIPDDDYDRAMKNLEREEMRERMKYMPQDGYTAYRNMVRTQGDRLYYAGQRPPMRIFDPFAWAKFFQAWRNGDFKRDD